MKKKITDRKIVVINQASNYLTIGFTNAFYARFEDVTLITGSIRTQEEALNPNVKVQYINQWYERPARKKALSYAQALLRMWWLLFFKYRKHEVFFVSVPPMGYLLNLFLPHRFSMVIWDVYPDVFKITGMKESHFVYRVWSRLNKRSFKKAFRLFTISERMADLLEKYVEREKIRIQPIWAIFQANGKVAKQENPFALEHGIQDKFVVQYSGNIGLTHNVEVLVEVAEQCKEHTDILFQIIGRGPRKPVLERLVKEKQLPNCTFLPFQSNEMFPYSLSAADLGVVILDEQTSKGSVPSKSYNLMSYGIPSLYIASADSQLNIYAETYAHGGCFSKEDMQSIVTFIVDLKNDRAAYRQMTENALRAAQDFRRANADKLIEMYLS
ncbi:glycosyltransferase [Nitritalea halalkaliphila LW7]|uniref:Glycosyltransferase n=1 Tax=Nitritalea halalkaliphila LW7 TaxID=1189621 RepID=I5C605_9BACT|nr:glycosyltransferase family 4 protein [Nitritalea halalkaliphila]EIM77257.1 glycosyltransferase [Nitritalea halalkaliphila LW7]